MSKIIRVSVSPRINERWYATAICDDGTTQAPVVFASHEEALAFAAERTPAGRRIYSKGVAAAAAAAAEAQLWNLPPPVMAD